MVPPLKATPTAGGGGMLCNKDRMVFHGGLSSVVFGEPRGDASGNKIYGMLSNRIKPLFLKVKTLFFLSLNFDLNEDRLKEFKI